MDLDMLLKNAYEEKGEYEYGVKMEGFEKKE